ncbi:tetratricopeptide repeat protein [Murinocardiopsis flavida]|uniref:Tetratricopeptide repeat protein n=1 Tax=Murinocardiopsis flavida TaxID=645275 RepID=A0A2P8DLU7_9ACTN|nr:tetratricopeptide repeat protein [Murinocardiopsis flavida]
MSVWRSLLRKSGFPTSPIDTRLVAERAQTSGDTPGERAARLEQTLHEYVDTLGTAHPRSIAARNNLASKYAQIGRRSSAVAQFEQALADAVPALGEEHPQTDVIRENLALSYEDTGRYADAASLWEVLLTQRQNRLGAGADETVAARTRLADCYRRTGSSDAAIVHYERAIEDATGATPQSLDKLRLGLAKALGAAGRHDDAAPQLRMVLAQRTRRLGSKHHDTLAVLHRLALAYRKAGRDLEAVEHLRTAYRRCLSAAGDPEVRLLTMRVRRDLAGALRAIGSEKEAAALF